jgi:hypothetical protein
MRKLFFLLAAFITMAASPIVDSYYANPGTLEYHIDFETLTADEVNAYAVRLAQNASLLTVEQIELQIKGVKFFLNIVLPAGVFEGQSNMEGDNTSDGTVATTAEVRAFTFYKPNDTTATDNGRIESIVFGRNNNWRTSQLTSAGPEMGFSKSWSAAHSIPCVILKFSLGGTSLVDDGTVTSVGNWQIDTNPANGPPLYKIGRNNFIIPAITKLQARGIYLNIAAVVWMQGEADANDGTGYKAARYENELKRLIDKTITDLSRYDAIQGIKPIITRIHNNFSPARPYQNEIRTAQQNVAAYYNMSYINSDSYELRSDFIHFTKTSQGTHGADIYTLFNALVPGVN